MEDIFHENKTDYSGSDHNRCVYMLLAGKLQKFGGISVMGIVMGLFFLISGHFITSFATNILMGIAADFVAWTGKYQNRKKLLASYILFSYGLFGPELPLWFMKDAYITNLEARGKDASYIADLFAIPSAWKAEQP